MTSTNPRTILEAKELGLKRYWPETPCKYGHVAARNFSRQCLECRKRIVNKARLKRLNLPVPEPKKEVVKKTNKKNVWNVRQKYYFNRETANRVVRFFQNRLVHVEGEKAGQPFVLERWQRKLLRRAFGWINRKDGTRKYRTVYLEVPRKNGKSALASGIGLYLTYGDREEGARVVSAAAETEQAAIVFDVAKKMVEKSPKLMQSLKPFKRSIVHYESGSNYKVVSAEAYSKHGKNLHGIIFDELHAQPNRELYDVLKTSTGSRRQPMEWYLTTAGYDRFSICYEVHEYANKVNSGIIEDESFLGVIFAAGQDDDWRDPRTWYKANPNLGISKKLDYMIRECDRAQKTPGYENTFKRLELNIWTEQDSRWLSMSEWDANDTTFDEAMLEGKDCFGGLDLSTTTDITALTLVFPLEDGKYYTINKFWIPEENARKRALNDRVPYVDWIRDGFITATEGNSIDYTKVEADIVEYFKKYNILELQYDRWNATHITQRLEGHGLEMIPMTQSFQTLSGPSLEIERLITQRKLAHNNNPVLKWMARNVAVLQNGEGQIRPSKKKSRERIDGIMTLVMAIDRVCRAVSTKSVYEERDLIVI